MSDVDDLVAFLSASPSPYHAVAEATKQLLAAGFERVDLADEWPDGPGSRFVAKGGALIAWSTSTGATPSSPFRIVGAHTDSPNLRLKPRPDTGGFGWKQLAVEVYGGALWNSWLDRDLGLSGRVAVRSVAEPMLVHVDRPLARVPQLAIHLERGVNEQGLKLDPQRDLTPVWGVGTPSEGDLASFLAEELSGERGTVGPADVVGWDLMFHDVTPPARLGRTGELIASARLDNLVSCWAAIAALTAGDTAADIVPVVCLYDHEEVGSTSSTGANSSLVDDVLERIVRSGGGERTDLLRARAGSICASADMAHATHPNRSERHEPGHHIRIDGGPVIKVNANQRYATDATTAATMVEACERAGVPHQWFVSRNDQPCGSTIGPLTAARLGIPTVDIGVAQLSMHSARELCAAEEPARLSSALRAFLAPTE